MAKTQKYRDELLLEAVVKYATQHRGKIEATKLARWASENIVGLEGVADRHFMRPVQKKDPKTGKMVLQAKLCTTKIEELNAARSNRTAVNTNILLNASSVDKFLSLKAHEQRKLILETRTQFDKLIAENTFLRSENKAVKTTADTMAEKLNELEMKIGKLCDEHKKLLPLVAREMRIVDEAKRREMLASIGVCDGLFDLDTYVNSLTVKLSEVFSINEIMRKFQSAVLPKVNPKRENDLMDGIEF